MQPPSLIVSSVLIIVMPLTVVSRSRLLFASRVPLDILGLDLTKAHHITPLYLLQIPLRLLIIAICLLLKLLSQTFCLDHVFRD
jgi:hypothetical protein